MAVPPGDRVDTDKFPVLALNFRSGMSLVSEGVLKIQWALNKCLWLK